MKKILSLFIAFVMLFSCISTLSSCDSNDTSTPSETERRSITLTKQNFHDYFAYEVTGQAYYTEKSMIWYNGEIVLTFYPIKNFEVENCNITIAIKDTPSDGQINVYQYVNGEVEDKVTRDIRVPYDGKFTVTFNNHVGYRGKTYNATKK